MNLVQPNVKSGTTATGEPLEITLFQPSGDVVISPALAGLPPLRGPAQPLAASGWYGYSREAFEVWRVNGEYRNPSTGQSGPALRDALPYPVAKGRW